LEEDKNKDKPQDDKRFFRQDSEQERIKKEEKEKRMPIELPDLDSLSSKEPPPSSTPPPPPAPTPPNEKKAEPEPPPKPPSEEKTPEQPKEMPPQKTPPIPDADDEKKLEEAKRKLAKSIFDDSDKAPGDVKKPKGIKFKDFKVPDLKSIDFKSLVQKQKKKIGSFLSSDYLKKVRPALPVIFILVALLSLSLFSIALHRANTSNLQNRLVSNAEAVKDLAGSKEDLIKENIDLQDEVDRLRKELLTKSSQVEIHKRDADYYKKEIERQKEKYAELEKSLKDYADEIRALAVTRIGYYDAYKKQKNTTQKLTGTIENMQKQLVSLKSTMENINKETEQKESKRIYEQAFEYIDRGMFDKAVEAFEKYMDINGEDANIYYNLAYINEKVIKNRRKALEYYNKYLELKPEAEDLYEVKMKIASLKRVGTKEKKKSFANFKINLDSLKY